MEYDDYGLDEPEFDWPRPESVQFHRHVFRWEGDVQVPEDRSEWIEGRYTVGESYRSHYAAPGVGYHEWECTRVDEQGAWGYTVNDTGRILEAWEVE